jgi:hypothetical protein
VPPLQVKEVGMRLLVVMLVCMLLVIIACGGSSAEEGAEDAGGPTTEVSGQDSGGDTADSGTTAPQTDTTQTSANSGDESPAPEVGEAGSFTVNGTEFAVTLLNRCIPFSDAPGNTDLQGLSQGTGAKINLVQAGEMTEVSVDGSRIEEMFGSIAFGGDSAISASTVSGDRWTGSATVGDSLGSGKTVDITWDVMVPAEAQDCGL